MTKLELLKQKLVSYQKVAIAFSGGADSTFLFFVAREVLGDRAIAITVKSPYIPDWEFNEALELAAGMNATHEIIYTDIPENIKDNPADRCYLCKLQVFTKISEKAAEKGITYIADGSNADDIKDYRPGMKALKELHIVSPLLESGITKEEIRLYSKAYNLPTWNKPAYACLLTRLPYGKHIQPDDLKKIEISERILHSLGFKSARVRLHENLARIEIPTDQIIQFTIPETLTQIRSQLKSVGFSFITLDIEGYKMGSFNKDIL